MAVSSSDPMVCLFKLGAVGTLSDAQLLDRFVGRRDEVAEAAFEELVIRAIESPCPWVEALAFTPSGEQIVAGLSDTSIVIWDAGPTDKQQRRSKAE
jgi:hypothetical protein